MEGCERLRAARGSGHSLKSHRRKLWSRTASQGEPVQSPSWLQPMMHRRGAPGGRDADLIPEQWLPAGDAAAFCGTSATPGTFIVIAGVTGVGWWRPEAAHYPTVHRAGPMAKSNLSKMSMVLRMRNCPVTPLPNTGLGT